MHLFREKRPTKYFLRAASTFPLPAHKRKMILWLPVSFNAHEFIRAGVLSAPPGVA